MIFRSTVAGLPLAALASGSAFACEPNWSTDPLDYARADTRLELAPDCSFEDGSLGWTESGNPVRDRGNMRIAQKRVIDGACGPHEQLLFVDCSNGEVVVFEGRERPDGLSFGGGVLTSIEIIQKPTGPLSLTSDATVSDLIETAEKHGIEFFTDFVARQKKEKRKNRYDAYCGCKLYYPDSVGAKMPKP